MTAALRSRGADLAGNLHGSARGAGINALYSIRKGIDGLFSKYGDDLEGVTVLAEGVSAAVEAAGAFIERHTSVVCPECRQVCCINRHAYHDLNDIILIRALGERPPVYKIAADDTEPCQFLGKKGCRVRRPLRPHRCNWYFCEPLLGHIRAASAREYRRFVAGLRAITEKREGLMAAFSAALQGGGHDLESLRRASDEFFFM